MYNAYRISKFKRLQKFVDTKVVRRNSVGRNLVSADSCTLFYLVKNQMHYKKVIANIQIKEYNSCIREMGEFYAFNICRNG